MSKQYDLSLFIFRRDLRLADNTGLTQAMLQSTRILPCFIIDPIQVGPENHYRSLNAMQFMVESLHDLAQAVKEKEGELYLFQGKPHEVVSALLKQLPVQAVFVNHDYTPYSRQRDSHLQKICTQHNVAWHSSADLLLQEPAAVLKKDGTPYQIFTPFYRVASSMPVPKPCTPKAWHWFTEQVKEAVAINNLEKLVSSPNNQLHVHGGTSKAKTILHHLSEFKHYATQRDIPALAKTTGLSAHLKFGTCSVRQAFHAMRQALGPNHPLLRQLYWRDFLTHIAYHFSYVFGHAFNQDFQHIEWDNDRSLFKRWQTGTTGFPIVDAGMRQLAQTGFMHNRVRMIVASFLVKDLLIDWRWGERHFAQLLVDYDPSVNNGNWQWAASTGCDAQPYFRIFNPWLQQKKFDVDCTYIKQWVPELHKIPAKAIHAWHTMYQTIKSSYPAPCVEHAINAAEAKARFTAARKQHKKRKG